MNIAHFKFGIFLFGYLFCFQNAFAASSLSCPADDHRKFVIVEALKESDTNVLQIQSLSFIQTENDELEKESLKQLFYGIVNNSFPKEKSQNPNVGIVAINMTFQTSEDTVFLADKEIVKQDNSDSAMISSGYEKQGRTRILSIMTFMAEASTSEKTFGRLQYVAEITGFQFETQKHLINCAAKEFFNPISEALNPSRYSQPNPILKPLEDNKKRSGPEGFLIFIGLAILLGSMVVVATQN